MLGVTLIIVTIKSSNNIEDKIVMVDTLIKDNQTDEATKLLNKISKKAPDRYSFYRLIKRSIEISEVTDDYQIMANITFAALNKFPGNEDLYAYYVMALLKTGKYSEAYNIAIDNLVSAEYKPLLAQSLLYFENKTPELLTILEYIESRKEPSFFEYLAHLLNNNELLIDAVLLWANNGEIEKAYTLLNEIKEPNAELKALLAYDSGRESEALLKLLELPESDSIKYSNLLLIADIFFMKENWARSKFYYDKAIQVNKSGSAPYLNIASIYLKSDSIKKAILFLQNGIDDFDKNIQSIKLNIMNIEEDIENLTDINEKKLNEKLLDKAKGELKALSNDYKDIILLFYHLNKIINTDETVKILENYRENFEKDGKIELLYLKEQKEFLDPDLFESKLWKLLNEDIENRTVSEYLIWYLLGVENYKDINLVLERSKHRFPDENWTNYYYGILSGLNKDYSKAIEYFSMSDIDVSSWELLYNTGVIEMARKNYSEALTLFNKSIILLVQENFIDNRDKYLSQIKTKLAQVLISLNDTDEAIRVLNSAYELDPTNYTSDLLKSVYLNLQESK